MLSDILKIADDLLDCKDACLTNDITVSVSISATLWAKFMENLYLKCQTQCFVSAGFISFPRDFLSLPIR